MRLVECNGHQSGISANGICAIPIRFEQLERSILQFHNARLDYCSTIHSRMKALSIIIALHLMNVSLHISLLNGLHEKRNASFYTLRFRLRLLNGLLIPSRHLTFLVKLHLDIISPWHFRLLALHITYTINGCHRVARIFHWLIRGRLLL